MGRKAAGCAGRQSTDCVTDEAGGGGKGWGPGEWAAHGHDLAVHGASARSSLHERVHTPYMAVVAMYMYCIQLDVPFEVRARRIYLLPSRAVG